MGAGVLSTEHDLLPSKAHLGAKAIAEAVGEAGGGVVVHARRIHLAQELLRGRLVVCSGNVAQVVSSSTQ